ncbi:MAG TPA: S26 family signal peptidase, partial [Euryarchaeota archaeon]|nr:S26 family signal peptidase [Euryarchaeota archaeon]
MPDEQPGAKRKIPPTVIDIVVAVAIVASILIGMFIYTGIWPPLVVVESKSMQHSADESSIGTIDTGDLVLIKKVSDKSDITTYLEGKAKSYRSYGDFGDVIVYKRGGSDERTPIIHRAVIYLTANEDGASFRA